MGKGIEGVISGRQRKPPRVTIYGQEGIGKSSFGASAPAPIFLQTEDGLGEIDCDRLPLATSFGQFVAQLGQVCSGEHEYQTLVVDTLDWLEKLIWAETAKRQGKASIDEIGYAKGYSYALDLWKEVVSGFDYARNERGMATLLLAHAKIERFEDPESQGYDRYTLRLHKLADAYIREWSDAVMFATRRQRVEKVGSGFNERTIAKPIGTDGGERVLRTVGGPACTAKNRYGVVGEIPLAWQAFADAAGF